MGFSKLLMAVIKAHYPSLAETGLGLANKRPTPSADPSRPPVANTRGATPRKPIVDKGKKKVVDKGKGKMVEPLKLEKFQLRTGGALRIVEQPQKLVAPQLQTTGPLKMEGKKKKPKATPPRVARVLKLLDKPEESKEPKEPEIPQVKRRKLVKASDVELTFVASTEPALKLLRARVDLLLF
jgi:hypothetical protein